MLHLLSRRRGNLVGTPGDCTLSTNGIVDNANQGVRVGGKSIDGLGSSGAAPTT